MPYIPLNRIQTNLFTAGNEYYNPAEKKPYQGYYHRYYNGRIFTGKTPYNQPSQELQILTNQMMPDAATETIAIAPYNPTPTPEQYLTGEFQRYFVKQVNALKYIEINLETYTGVNQKKPGLSWMDYTPLSIPWSISGEESKVSETNKNIVQLTERLKKIQGFGLFLQEDYLKFYKK
jgi:hypothetical protein